MGFPENWEHTLDVKPEDYLVTTPVLGKIYHISWTKSEEMCWILKKIVDDIAYLETPKTKKPIQCKISELRETSRQVFRKVRKRPYWDYFKWGKHKDFRAGRSLNESCET